MRDSNRSSPRGRGRLVASLVIVGLVAACGASAPSASPSPTAVYVAPPTPTPDPHLTDPVSADDLFRALQTAGLKVAAYTASTGPRGEPVNLINGTYDGWPLIISEYSSAKALAKAKKWKAGAKLKQGEPPIAIKGLNILLEWGPTTGKKPPKLDAGQQVALQALIEAIDPLLYPLASRTSIKVAMPVHTPEPTASPASSASPSPTP
jgi:hypothetical protein